MTWLLLAVLFVVTILVQSAPVQDVVLLKYENQPNIGDGNYYFTYEISDGTSRKESGKVEKESDGSETLIVFGSYSYIGNNGLTYLVTYQADKGGYRVLNIPKSNVPLIQNAPGSGVIDDTDITKSIAVGRRISSALLGSLVGGGLG